MVSFRNLSLSWPACSGLSICILKNLPSGLSHREDVPLVLHHDFSGHFFVAGY